MSNITESANLNSLCKKCIGGNNNNKWYPMPISTLESVIEKKIAGNDWRSLRKNIAYNLQYLEFQIEIFKQMDLSAVLYVQNYKMFVLVSASIIEAILFYELKRSDYYKKTLWNKIATIISNDKSVLNKRIRLETRMFEHMDCEVEEEMSFDQMLQKVESKKLLGEDHNIYASIKQIRKLRNKVHLYLIYSNSDTDYFNFSFDQLNLAQKTLLRVLQIYFDLTQQEINSAFVYLTVDYRNNM